jgi:ribosomal protein L13E
VSRASKRRKKTPEKAKEVQTVKEEKTMDMPKLTGEVPKATVVSRHETSALTRYGRGFSDRELASVGLDFKRAMSQGVQVDLRRGSLLEANVTRLRSWFKPTSAPPKTERVPKVVKEEKASRVVKEEKAPKVAKAKVAEKTKRITKTKKRAGKKSK